MKSFEFQRLREPVDSLQLVFRNITFVLYLRAFTKTWNIRNHYMVVTFQVLCESYPGVFIGSKTMDQ